MPVVSINLLPSYYREGCRCDDCARMLRSGAIPECLRCEEERGSDARHPTLSLCRHRDAPLSAPAREEVCPTCRNTRPLSDVTIDGRARRLCASCVITCSDCGEAWTRGDSRAAYLPQGSGRGLICGACRRGGRYRHCYAEQIYAHESLTVYLGGEDAWATQEWAQENNYHDTGRGEWTRWEEEPRRMSPRNYSDNVLDYCGHDRTALAAGALMFGVELEMEPRRDTNLIEVFGGNRAEHYILKSDGSLNDGGVELVTIPLTLDGHRLLNWESILAPVVRGHVARSGSGTTHCGMHVHINKSALSALTIGKMLVFLNDPDTRAGVELIAQRRSNGYCARSRKKIGDGKRRSESRYDILNVGRSTVEVRLFRGNLRFQRVLKNLEFCHALVLYCQDASAAKVASWGNFLGWLRPRCGEYPMLAGFLAAKGTVGFKQPRVGLGREV